MKVKISYSDNERIAAQAVAALIQRTVKGITRKDASANGEYRHIYMATPKRH